MLKVAVFTATFGGTHPPKDPSIVAPGVRYLCASDRPLASKVWQRVELSPADHPVQTFKILLHEHAADAHFYAWVDSAYQLDVDPLMFAPSMMRHDVLALRHPDRTTIEQEAAAIIER